MLKILFIANIPNTRTGGMARIIHYLGEELCRQGHAAEYVFQGEVRSLFPSRRVSEFLYPFQVVFLLLRRWRRSARPNIVVIHTLEANFYVFLRRMRFRLPPCVVLSFGADEQRWQLEKEEEKLGLRHIRLFSKIFYDPFVIWRARYATRFADRVMVAARSEIDFYEQRYKMERERVSFIPNGVSPDFFIPRDYQRHPRKLLYLGGWEWRKGIRYLAQGFTAIARSFKDVTLTVAGTRESREVILKWFPEDIHSRIITVSSLPEEALPSFYAQHEIFVFPSLFESMSLVVPEAMASGLAVVTTRTCGMQDIVEDGVSGYLIPPRDADALKMKVSEFLTHPGLCEKMGRKAQETALGITWDKIAGKFLSLCKELLPEQGACQKMLLVSNTPNNWTTGMGRHLHYLEKELKILGKDVDLVFHEDVPRLPVFRRLSSFLFSFLLLMPFFRLSRKKRGFDLVMIHTLEGFFYVLLRQFFRGLPKGVIFSYGADELRWRLELEEERLGYRRIRLFSKIFYGHLVVGPARYAMRHCDHLIVGAYSEKAFCEKEYGMVPEKISVISHGVSREFFQERNYRSHPQKLLFLGGWEWRKGTRYLVEAFSAIAVKYTYLEFCSAGVGVPSEEVLKAFDPGVRQRILVLSHLPNEDVPRLMSEHDIFVFPSLFESVPLVLPEAMASGLAVVTSRACGMQDVIDDGVNGLLVAPRDVKGLVDKISVLIDTPGLAEKLGREAKKKAESLTWDKIAGQTLAVFEKTVKENPNE